MFIRIKTVLLAALLLGGCGDTGDDGSESPPVDAANLIFDGLTLTASKGTVGVVNGKILQTGTGSGAPQVSSFPDVIEAARLSTENLEVGFSSAEGVSKLRLSVEGADRRFEIQLPQPQAGFSGIALTLTIPADAPRGMFCLLSAAVDVSSRVSDAARGCVDVAESDSGVDRVIHFATFENSSKVGTLNFDTLDVQIIGRAGAQLGDIAFLGEKLYGVDSGNLYYISLIDGHASNALNLGAASTNALVGRDGVLYAATESGSFLTIDPAGRQVLSRTSLGAGIGSSGDLAFLDDGRLVLTARISGRPTDYLVVVDRTTGLATQIGDIGFALVYGVGMFRGQLLGLTFAGEFILIDQVTGRGALIAETDADLAGGASIAP